MYAEALIDRVVEPTDMKKVWEAVWFQNFGQLNNFKVNGSLNC